jgi:hypothetical protein
MASKADIESEYKIDDVAATRVASDKIDATFKSSSIGKWKVLWSMKILY